ncbi:tagaturonate reductase [Marinoscillum sp. MHG1-6]|uniref:tagaturonate reductase n=1 Tax=Marinoscillum sp. MHG1-6 TaxID=2959627 RepID=UPI002157B68B|nr:tagaturonate reductase [Marinoscillum sp. MHG1-6]
METTITKLNRANANTQNLPIKIVQFGEGNFLRAFVDWFIDQLNEKADYNAGVAIVQPLEFGMVDMLAKQDSLYHHLLQGLENGKTVDDARLISCVQKAINPFQNLGDYYALAEEPTLKIVFSNTTEAGIVFDENDQPEGKALATTFPGKLTQLLKHRFDHFSGSDDAAVGIIPCELIESNGDKLKKCIEQYIQLWDLGSDFASWVAENIHFANTLVDRIVPGYPKDEINEIKERIGYDDNLVVKSESFHLFVIEGDEFIQEHFPAHKHGFNVKYVKSITPYRTQKVRILNGAHTSMVPVGLLSGIETVKETVDGDVSGKFVNEAVFNEIVETISIPGEDPKDFAKQVIARFQNPFIRHELISISLNSISKYKVRVLPTVLDYLDKKGSLPDKLVFSLACLIELYLSDKFTLKDTQEYLDFFVELKSSGANKKTIASKVLANTAFWDQDLTQVTGLTQKVTDYLEAIEESGVVEVSSKL